MASPTQAQDVLAQVRLLCPAAKVQLVAAHFTSTRGLATTKPMLQEGPGAACANRRPKGRPLGSTWPGGSPVLHCTSRLPGSSRAPRRPSGGKAQLKDLSVVAMKVL